MAQINTKLALDQAKKAADNAEKNYRKQSKLIRKKLKDANSELIAADRLRAKSRHDLRLAKKAHHDEQDRQQIQKNEKGGV